MRYKKLNYKVLLLSCIFITIFACKKNSNTILHPTDDFLSYVTDLDNKVSLRDGENLSGNIETKIIRSAGHLLGSSHKTDDEYMPDITQVTLDEIGNIYVAVNSLSIIKVFDKDGVFKFDIGGNGRGPGEFLQLSGIAYDKQNKQLIALDRNEIEIFSLKKDTAVHKETIFTEIKNSTNVCVLGDSFYINGYSIVNLDSPNKNSFETIQASEPIHQFDLGTGKYVYPTCKNYNSVSNYGVFNGILSKTFIACDESTKTVIGLLSIYPLITGYNPSTGTVKWESGITEFNFRGYIETTETIPKLKRRIRNKFYDDYFSLIDLFGKFVLLQVGYGIPYAMPLGSISKNSNSGELSWRFVIINTENGRIQRLKNSNSANRIIFADSITTVELKAPKIIGSEPKLLINKK